jgi:hypothetical protein
MNEKTISQDYANDVMFDLEKAFWDERGLGARFRTVSVGREHFKSKVLPLLKSTEIGQFVQAIEQALQSEGIVSRVSATEDGRLLRVRVEGCVHRVIEEQMGKLGIPPFTCVPANLVAFAIEEKLDRPVELAEVKVEEGACNLLLVLFDQRPVLR